VTAVGTPPPPAPPGEPADGPRRRWGFDRRRLRLGLVFGVIAGALAFLLLQGLDNATLYFRNADEAVAQRDELGTRRFRIQGLVVDEPVVGDGVATFEITYNDVVVPIRLTDGIPDLFQVDRPVVMEGRFAEGADVLFLADRIFVKHDEVYEEDDGTYEEEHPDRIDEAEDGEEGR
jgi:cytochrome c-type biogenesis protein CcmE